MITVPHAGRYYPAEIEKQRAVSRRALEQLEDRHADRLVCMAVEAGAVAIVGTHARAWIDLNRGEEDAFAPDDARASQRARAGLGLVPSRAGGRWLWRSSPDIGEVRERMAGLHAPYHRAIAEALVAARENHGFALLVDCHSMPPLGQPGRPAARIVIGDRHGESARPAIAQAALAVSARHRLLAARNRPYAGAFTIGHHGSPTNHVHAIQVEIDRTLYLEPGLREPSARLSAIAGFFSDLCWHAVRAITHGEQVQAAE